MKIFSTLTLICLLLPDFAWSQGCCNQNPLPDFSGIPQLAWKFKSTLPFFASPVIDESTVYVGGLDSTLYALETGTGNVKWKFRTGGAIRSNVAINMDLLFLNGGDGNLYCLDKNTGKTNWIFKAGAEKQYDVFDYYQSSPTVVKYCVYFGGADGKIYCVNKLNGQSLWNFQTDDIVHTTPAIFDAKLYAGSFDGNVYCIDDKTGSLVWKFKTLGHNYFRKGELEFSPTVVNAIVFTGGRDYNLYALDIDGGYCHWNRSFEGGWATTITSSQKNDSLIYVSTSDDRLLLCMNGVTSAVKWKTEAKSNIMGGCALTGGMGYYGTLLGKIYGFDKKTGKIQWGFGTDGYNTNHQLYYKQDDSFRDDIFSIIKTDEEFIKAQYKTGGIYSTPAVDRNVLVVSSTDGTVYCFKH